ncbi:hypothetical protein D6764_01405 [Candidatus Woesearchaeota archaeon]|nr:MAG: hypothetical protein D6764_01405 [Candidatus Woesearchaeota archaeon]
MAASKLAQDREAMIEFMREHTAGDNLDVLVEKLDSGMKRHILQFRDENGVLYNILLLSRQGEFAPEFDYRRENFDEDRRKMLAVWNMVSDFIAQKNEEGKVPGFVFLRSDTRYEDLRNGIKTPLEEREKRIINEGGHFLKQALPNEWNPNPYFDERELDPLEVVVKQFNYKNEGLPGRKPTYQRRKIYTDSTARGLGKKVYTPENYYFNPKTGQLDVIWFMDLGNPYQFRMTECPVCSNPNGDYDHSSCKEQPAYSRYRFERDRARYSKLILRPKDRQPGEDIFFDPVKLVLSAGYDSRIARVRAAKEMKR